MANEIISKIQLPNGAVYDIKDEGAKTIQAEVSSPTASGTTLAFIDTISQNTQGVITATKKTVASASTNAAGLMSVDDKTKLDGIDAGAQVNSITGVKGNAESTYRTGNINLTPANIGAKTTQTAVTSPTASGTAISFIDTISQNTQGVITPTKKTVPEASQSAAGLMSADDKKKLDGIAVGAQVNGVTGVKGNSETNYRAGNVNITPANIGLGTTTNNLQAFSNFGGSNHVFGLNFTVDNTSNTEKNGHSMIFLIKNAAIELYDQNKDTSGGGTEYAIYPIRVKGNAESTYRTGDVNLTPANIGALPSTTTFVSGVKGYAESTYRSGNVSITPANIGAFGINSASGTITDANNINLYGTRFFQADACANLPSNASGVYYQVEFMGTFQMAIGYAGENARPIYSRYFANDKWYSWQKIVDINTSGLVTVAGGGTGATNAHDARVNLSAAYEVNIAGDVSTWSGIYQELSGLPNYTTGTIYAGSGPASKLTGGKLTSYINGVVTRMSDNIFDFMVQSGANPAYMYGFRVTGLTNSAGTPGTVYRFTGSAI